MRPQIPMRSEPKLPHRERQSESESQSAKLENKQILVRQGSLQAEPPIRACPPRGSGSATRWIAWQRQAAPGAGGPPGGKAAIICYDHIETIVPSLLVLEITCHVRI